MSFLTLARLRTDSPAACDHTARATASLAADAGQQLVRSLFGGHSGGSRDYLYRSGSSGRFLVVSVRQPRGDPALWDLQTVSYQPETRAGERLAFSLRLNPSVNVAEPGRKRSRRVDIFQYARLRPGSCLAGSRLEGETTEEIALSWLQHKLSAAGACLDPSASRLCAHHRLKVEGKGATLTVIDVEGWLTIVDPSLMQAALVEGIGHGKAFGLGLLLLGTSLPVFS